MQGGEPEELALAIHLLHYGGKIYYVSPNREAGPGGRLLGWNRTGTGRREGVPEEGGSVPQLFTGGEDACTWKTKGTG